MLDYIYVHLLTIMNCNIHCAWYVRHDVYILLPRQHSSRVVEVRLWLVVVFRSSSLHSMFKTFFFFIRAVVDDIIEI
jgi:hypothetical protein